MVKAFYPNKTLTFEPRQGRRFAIGDVHGCFKTLHYLVTEVIQLTQDDQLFLLGDYINRGPDSPGVLHFLIYLQQNGYQVFPLRGNHEQMLLDDWKDYQRLHSTQYQSHVKNWTLNNAFIDKNGQLMPELDKFLNNLPYYYELNDFYLVHAGFDFDLGVPHALEDFERMLWVRYFEPDYAIIQQKPILHGHTTRSIDEIQASVKDRTGAIPLDNGCYKSLREIYNPYYGSLCGLNLDSFELVVVENMDRS
ncbi:metallophosphoesterase [Microscilla marina]|uniref:Metallophosphoesterase n=1 Tax=Microscilla marina ATCC 23134 TaxID=313606 RepID=A1ZS23_MICM2|nr:metallophosphoesterase [Microscilla marina]EAY26746.1 metallophosphoesterase [Microscilla marina ATCC 23134]